ncbi:MAG TPA: glycosyltransferase family 2 protein [Candidatus Paceibacterota bacterium]
MISIVIPVYNEKESIGRVVDEVRDLYPDAEIIVANDGSTDGTTEAIKSIPGIRTVSFASNKGKGFAIYEGLLASSGDICATMDGDGQSDPRDIGRLVEALKKADCAFGYREKRESSISKKIGGIIGNKARMLVLGSGATRDAGCALKAFRKGHVQHLFPFEGLHRFIPDLLAGAELSIAELSIAERPRFAGKSKYSNSGRAVRGLSHLMLIRKHLSRKMKQHA